MLFILKFNHDDHSIVIIAHNNPIIIIDNPNNNSILISQCGDAMEKVTVAMAATRKIVQLLTVSEERSAQVISYKL